LCLSALQFPPLDRQKAGLLQYPSRLQIHDADYERFIFTLRFDSGLPHVVGSGVSSHFMVLHDLCQCELLSLAASSQQMAGTEFSRDQTSSALFAS
jgi:hypothetical protein